MPRSVRSSIVWFIPERQSWRTKLSRPFRPRGKFRTYSQAFGLGWIIFTPLGLPLPLTLRALGFWSHSFWGIPAGALEWQRYGVDIGRPFRTWEHLTTTPKVKTLGCSHWISTGCQTRHSAA